MANSKELIPIQRQCLDGKLGMIETVDTIDTLIGKIKAVDYKPGKKCTIYNTIQTYTLKHKGLDKKSQCKLNDLAVLCYAKAIANGSIAPGELHISKDASTKHHPNGIYDILRKYQ